MAENLPPPLSGPPPSEVRLPTPPLVRVIAQVRFPGILKIRNPDTAAGFQECIRSTYPVLEKEQARRIELGGQEIREEIVWRFRDRARAWRVSLGTNFVSLETTKYESRQDFLDRLQSVVSGIEETLNPQEAQRLGVRYVDRLTGPAVDQITDLIRKEVLGVLPSDIGQIATHILTESHFSTEEGQLNARWGKLPPHATTDPDAVEPCEAPSWIIDLDMFTSDPQTFSTPELIDNAKRFTERVYSVFRWMVTDSFLKFYGGNP